MLHARMLRYLDEVARAGSIRRAAERLHISPSSINRQIIELEAEIGSPLFERLPRKLRLTASGEILIDHIRQTLREHERARRRIEELAGVGRGMVRVATVNGLASGLFPELCRSFNAKFPGVSFGIHSLTAPEVASAVEEGEVDFGLAYNLVHTPRQRQVATFDARLGAIMSVDHPLAHRQTISLSELTDQRVIMAGKSLTIFGIIDAACRHAKVDLRAVAETNSVQVMKFLVREGNAIAFLSPADVESEVSAGQFAFVHIRERLAPNRLRLVQRANAAHSPSTSVFIKATLDKLHELMA